MEEKIGIILKIAIIVAVLIIAGSVFYHYVIYLPREEGIKSELAEQQRIKEGELQGQKEEIEKQIDDAKKKLDEETQNKITELQERIQGLEEQPQKSTGDYSTWDITQGMGKYIVKVICFDLFDNEIQGSGIILGNNEAGDKTIILTNYHVIEDVYIDYRGYLDPENYTIYNCVVFYSPNPSIAYTKMFLATPVSFKDISLSYMKKYDFGFLQLEEAYKENLDKSLIIGDGKKPVFCKEDLFVIGKEVVILGYPTIGGKTLIATEGVISGFDDPNYYLITSAKIEQGNSGGGAFLKSDGCLIGIPTFVRVGVIESMGRLIEIPWLNKKFLSKIYAY